MSHPQCNKHVQICRVATCSDRSQAGYQLRLFAVATCSDPTVFGTLHLHSLQISDCKFTAFPPIYNGLLGILVQSITEIGDHHSAEFGRLDDLDAWTIAEKLLHEVGSKTQTIAEYGVTVVDYFILRMVQG